MRIINGFAFKWSWSLFSAWPIRITSNSSRKVATWKIRISSIIWSTYNTGNNRNTFSSSSIPTAWRCSICCSTRRSGRSWRIPTARASSTIRRCCSGSITHDNGPLCCKLERRERRNSRNPWKSSRNTAQCIRSDLSVVYCIFTRLIDWFFSALSLPSWRSLDCLINEFSTLLRRSGFFTETVLHYSKFSIKSNFCSVFSLH